MAKATRISKAGTAAVAVLVVALPLWMRAASADEPHPSFLGGSGSSPNSGQFAQKLVGSRPRYLGEQTARAVPLQSGRVSLPRGGLIRPKPPNIHTRPKKKSTTWWPFGRK